MTELLSPAEAVAHAARLSQASFIPSYPSIMSSEMGSVLARNDIRMVEFESQSSAISAAIGASTIGRRVFIPLASPQSISDFYSASFQRLPIVASNVSQCLATYTARSDMNDILVLRDAGWIILLAENNQEILDSIIMAYRISEEVLLPSIININGIQLREPVAVPGDKKILNFLKKPNPMKLDFKKPIAFNPPVEDYMEFKAQQQKAMDNALSAADKVCNKWKEKFGRSYSAVDSYLLDDADYAFVVAGSNSATCRAVVNKLRTDGEKVGMLRIRMLRPFPKNGITESLKNLKKVAIVDENISLGSSGIIYTELVQYYHGFACDFIAGLGRYLTERDFVEIFQRLKSSDTSERSWLL